MWRAYSWIMCSITTRSETSASHFGTYAVTSRDSAPASTRRACATSASHAAKASAPLAPVAS
ncbi:hypothetical protein GCM10010336_02170 [Streptomyces goshikiensis]|nr:hypothetical protein GCM10010336_02170 [Streptomyces goshikiensis]